MEPFVRNIDVPVHISSALPFQQSRAINPKAHLHVTSVTSPIIRYYVISPPSDLSELYHIGKVARQKLLVEVSFKGHDLYRLVHHANLYDVLLTTSSQQTSCLECQPSQYYGSSPLYQSTASSSPRALRLDSQQQPNPPPQRKTKFQENLPNGPKEIPKLATVLESCEMKRGESDKSEGWHGLPRYELPQYEEVVGACKEIDFESEQLFERNEGLRAREGPESVNITEVELEFEDC